MAHFYVIESRYPGDNAWTEELPDNENTVNLFKTTDDAWLCIDQIRTAGIGQPGVPVEYRVAIWAGPDDHEQVVGYSL